MHWDQVKCESYMRWCVVWERHAHTMQVRTHVLIYIKEGHGNRSNKATSIVCFSVLCIFYIDLNVHYDRTHRYLTYACVVHVFNNISPGKGLNYIMSWLEVLQWHDKWCLQIMAPKPLCVDYYGKRSKAYFKDSHKHEHDACNRIQMGYIWWYWSFIQNKRNIANQKYSYF